MFEDFSRERAIRKVLRGIARQRVVISLPGGPWVIEKAVPTFDGSEEALRTCEIRGWAEVYHDNLPTAHMTVDVLMNLSRNNLKLDGVGRIYRLTQAGWAELDRTHMWLLATFTVSAASLAAAAVGAYLTYLQLAK